MLIKQPFVNIHEIDACFSRRHGDPPADTPRSMGQSKQGYPHTLSGNTLSLGYICVFLHLGVAAIKSSGSIISGILIDTNIPGTYIVVRLLEISRARVNPPEGLISCAKVVCESVCIRLDASRRGKNLSAGLSRNKTRTAVGRGEECPLCGP